MTTAPTRCLYALRPHERPDCQLTPTVAYGPTALCSNCDRRRSTLGKGHAARPLPDTASDPTDLIIDAYAHLAVAHEELTAAVIRARQHQATWSSIAAVLGTTRQAAQQRFSRP
jgi:hypothetical protein